MKRNSAKYKISITLDDDVYAERKLLSADTQRHFSAVLQLRETPSGSARGFKGASVLFIQYKKSSLPLSVSHSSLKSRPRKTRRTFA